MGVQISRVAGGKVAKNGISASGWVALSGSVIFCTVGIFYFFAGYVIRVTMQHRTYISETLCHQIKNGANFKKCKIFAKFAHIWRAVIPEILISTNVSVYQILGGYVPCEQHYGLSLIHI